MSAGRETITLNLLDFDKPEMAIKHFVVIITSRVGVIAAHYRNIWVYFDGLSGL